MTGVITIHKSSVQFHLSQLSTGPFSSSQPLSHYQRLIPSNPMKQPFSHGFPMVFPWFSYGFPIWFSIIPSSHHLLETQSAKFPGQVQREIFTSAGRCAPTWRRLQMFTTWDVMKLCPWERQKNVRWLWYNIYICIYIYIYVDHQGEKTNTCFFTNTGFSTNKRLVLTLNLHEQISRLIFMLVKH